MIYYKSSEVTSMDYKNQPVHSFVTGTHTFVSYTDCTYTTYSLINTELYTSSSTSTDALGTKTFSLTTTGSSPAGTYVWTAIPADSDGNKISYGSVFSTSLENNIYMSLDGPLFPVTASTSVSRTSSFYLFNESYSNGLTTYTTYSNAFSWNNQASMPILFSQEFYGGRVLPAFYLNNVNTTFSKSTSWSSAQYGGVGAPCSLSLSVESEIGHLGYYSLSINKDTVSTGGANGNNTFCLVGTSIETVSGTTIYTNPGLYRVSPSNITFEFYDLKDVARLYQTSYFHTQVNNGVNGFGYLNMTRGHNELTVSAGTFSQYNTFNSSHDSFVQSMTNETSADISLYSYNSTYNNIYGWHITDYGVLQKGSIYENQKWTINSTSSYIESYQNTDLEVMASHSASYSESLVYNTNIPVMDLPYKKLTLVQYNSDKSKSRTLLSQAISMGTLSTYTTSSFDNVGASGLHYVLVSLSRDEHRGTLCYSYTIDDLSPIDLESNEYNWIESSIYDNTIYSTMKSSDCTISLLNDYHWEYSNHTNVRNFALSYELYNDNYDPAYPLAGGTYSSSINAEGNTESGGAFYGSSLSTSYSFSTLPFGTYNTDVYLTTKSSYDSGETRPGYYESTDTTISETFTDYVTNTDWAVNKAVCISQSATETISEWIYTNNGTFFLHSVLGATLSEERHLEFIDVDISSMSVNYKMGTVTYTAGGFRSNSASWGVSGSIAGVLEWGWNTFTTNVTDDAFTVSVSYTSTDGARGSTKYSAASNTWSLTMIGAYQIPVVSVLNSSNVLYSNPGATITATYTGSETASNTYTTSVYKTGF